MPRYKVYDKETLTDWCNSSTSYAEVLTLSGRALSGSNQTLLRKKIEYFEIDISHFTGQSHVKRLHMRTQTIDKYLNNEVGIKSHSLRQRLIEDGLFQHKCSNCGNSEWMGNPIPLELHHKDGNHKNNSLENLDILCPNCHALTSTYRGKNIRKSE